MATKQLPNIGDRVAYTAKFLKNIGAFTGSFGQRRGTLVAVPSGRDELARVRWDDFESNAKHLAEQYGDDYVEDARNNGQMVNINNIAKVGSARFADTFAY
jgi:hypothetical protein